MSLHKLLALNLFHLAAEAHTIIIVHHNTMNKSFDERHPETLDSKTSTKYITKGCNLFGRIFHWKKYFGGLGQFSKTYPGLCTTLLWTNYLMKGTQKHWTGKPQWIWKYKHKGVVQSFWKELSYFHRNISSKAGIFDWQSFDERHQ